jgi:N-acyl-L-homoserine lactone synthetase
MRKFIFLMLNARRPAFQSFSPKNTDIVTQYQINVYMISFFFSTILKEKKKKIKEIESSAFTRPTSWNEETSTQERANNETKVSPSFLRGFSQLREKTGEPILQKIYTIRLPKSLTYEGWKFTRLFRSTRVLLQTRKYRTY